MLSLFLSSCNFGGDGKGTEDSTPTESSDISTENSDNEDFLTIAANGTTEYSISYRTDADASMEAAAYSLKESITEAIGADLSIVCEKNGELTAETAKEIFIGTSARDAYASVYSDLTHGDWRIKVVGESVIIGATSLSATLDAFEYFTEAFFNSETVKIKKDYEYTHRAEYTIDNIRIDGIDISEYRLVYRAGSTASLRAAEDLFGDIARACGIELGIVKGTKNTSLDKAIVIGETVFHTSETDEYGESKVYVDGTTIYVDGTDIVGLERGVSYLSALLTSGKNVDVALSDISHEGTIQDRSTYVNDAAAFIPCYSERIEVSAEKLPISWKIAQLKDPSGESLVIAHRGEHTYYPENSLEAYISAWRIGAFSADVDIHKTKDGYWVAMHDDTVSRTTNVAVAQKENPLLPTSTKVSDWTLEELRQLRLVDDYGKVTPYPIPTLQEILHAIDGRMFINLDKSFDLADDIFPIMAEENVLTGIFNISRKSFSEIAKLTEYAENTYGITLYSMARTDSTVGITTYTNKIVEANSPTAILYKGDYLSSDEADNEIIADKYSDKVRFATWVLDESDYEFYWREADNYGYSIYRSDHPIELLSALS